MPAFSALGALVVFAWSRRLYGAWGGMLSLILWVFCPNVLAHARLITTDLGATALAVLATYVFWLYLQRPDWKRATLAASAWGSPSSPSSAWSSSTASGPCWGSSTSWRTRTAPGWHSRPRLGVAHAAWTSP